MPSSSRPAFEHHANFPERINTEFVQVVDAAHLKMRVWERGSGETFTSQLPFNLETTP